MRFLEWAIVANFYFFKVEDTGVGLAIHFIFMEDNGIARLDGLGKGGFFGEFYHLTCGCGKLQHAGFFIKPHGLYCKLEGGNVFFCVHWFSAFGFIFF